MSRERVLEPGQALAPLLVVVAAGVFLYDVTLLRGFDVDDTFITLRYARNVAAGLGPTYNSTGATAEGYTSPIWMLLLVVPHLLGAGPRAALATAKAFSLLATAATCTMVIAWVGSDVRDHEARPWAMALAAVGYLTSPRTALHAVSGMETALFALLLTTMFAAAAQDVHRSRPSALLPVLGLTAALTRPEGALAAVATLATVAALLPSDRRGTLARRSVVLFALPLAADEALRLWYYGTPLPLPFYVKLDTPAVFPGTSDVADWLTDHALRLGPLLLLPVFLSARPVLPAVASLVATAAFFVLPEHLMGYESRYLAPLDPAVYAIVAIAFGRGFERSSGRRFPVAARVALAAAVVVAIGVVGEYGLPDTIDDSLEYAEGLHDAHERLGRILSAPAFASTRLALSDGGVIPYLSGLWTLDLTGLNDPQIGTTHDRSPESIFSRDPGILVLVSRSSTRFTPAQWNRWEEALYEESRRRGYRCVAEWRFADDYHLWLIVASSETERALRENGLPAAASCPQ